MKKYLNVIFVVVCAVIFYVLWMAPAVKTPRIPDNATHVKPKEFERCPDCHLPGGQGPTMRADHLKEGKLLLDHVKCYMCHKLKNQ